MSKLDLLLTAPDIREIKKEVIPSYRLKDENGEYLKFTIRALNLDDTKEAYEASKRLNKKSKTVEADSFTELCNRIVAATVEPKLNSEELIEGHKCANAAAVVKKIFTPEEIQRLNFEIKSLEWQTPASEIAEETKNS